MKYYTSTTQFNCGIDLHARQMLKSIEARRFKVGRLFFRSPHEEALAVRMAALLASVVGDRITQLRPETTLSEIIQWTDSLAGD